MRKYIFTFLFTALFFSNAAYADSCPSDTAWKYESCKPGYYLSGGDCVACPAGTGVTTVDKNKGGITSCYTSTGGTDSTGTFEYTQPCYYSN